jgi:hypothetical protein
MPTELTVKKKSNRAEQTDALQFGFPLSPNSSDGARNGRHPARWTVAAVKGSWDSAHAGRK